MADAGTLRKNDERRLDAVIADLEKMAPTLGPRASRSASARLDAVQRILVYRAIETYDPADKEGFALVMTELAAKVPDLSALAGLFGISVSTLYRWKSGDSVPHRMVRAAIREHLLNLVAVTSAGDVSDSGLRLPSSN